MSNIDLLINSMNVLMGEPIGYVAISKHIHKAREDIAKAGKIAKDVGAVALNILAQMRAGLCPLSMRQCPH